MNPAESIALHGLRTVVKGAADYFEDMAADLAEDVDKDKACNVRLDAITRARAAARLLREASVDMRKLTHALEAMDEETPGA